VGALRHLWGWQVAPFPFTTLRPHLGTICYEDGSSIVVADIPGLIRGAKDNKGLGHDFLRHIERTHALAYVIDLSGGTQLSLECLSPVDQLNLLQVGYAYFFVRFNVCRHAAFQGCM
jgi:GTPase involved in cell partitioning and DNA repair